MDTQHRYTFARALLPQALVLCVMSVSAAPVERHAEQTDWEIRLHLDRGGWTRTGDAHPLGAGVPLRESQLWDAASLSLETDGHRPVPAEFDVRRRYDNGSIQWLWVDFQAQAASCYRIRPGGANPLPSPGVEVVDDGDTLSVSNGVLRLDWRKDGVTPRKVSLLHGATAETVVAGADGAGVYLITPTDERAAMAGPAADLEWTVETANRLKAVLLVQGWYVRAANGERMARGRVRFHIYWNQPWIKMDHTFIVTRSNDEVTYREIGVHWPLDAGRETQAHFGRVGRQPLRVALPNADEAWSHQAAYPVYHRKQALCRAGHGSKLLDERRAMSGWCELSNGRAGVLIAVKDCAQQFPKELTASRDGVTAKLWSGRGGRVLDYRPKTLIDEWWGDWFHRIMETYCRNGMPAHLREKTAWTDYNPPCIGVARTHELCVAFHAGAGSGAASEERFRVFQTEPLVLPDPRWTCHVGPKTFWPMAAKGEGGAAYDDIERLISTWFDHYVIPQQTFPFTGWYDWGRTPVDRYAVDRSEDGERVWAHWFRIGIVNRYMFNKYLMIAWARSGDRKYYELATRLNRFLRDYYVVQWGDRKGHFSQGSPWMLPVWGGGSLRPGVDSENMTGLALEYLFQGTEGCKDAILLVQDALLPAFQTTPAFTSTTPDMLMGSMTGLWRVSGDKTQRERIQRLHHAWTRYEDPAGVSAAFFSHWAGSHYANPLYKLMRKSMAMVEYAQVLGNEADRRLALKAARAVAPKYRTGTAPISYCNLSAAVCGSAYSWERDPELMATVAYQLETARKLFAAYEKLPASEKGLAHWLARANFSKCSYEAHYTFPELGLVLAKKDKRARDIPMRLAFSVDTAAAPLLSLPVAIGIVSGCIGTATPAP